MPDFLQLLASDNHALMRACTFVFIASMSISIGIAIVITSFKDTNKDGKE